MIWFKHLVKHLFGDGVVPSWEIVNLGKETCCEHVICKSNYHKCVASSDIDFAAIAFY